MDEYFRRYDFLRAHKKFEAAIAFAFFLLNLVSHEKSEPAYDFKKHTKFSNGEKSEPVNAGANSRNLHRVLRF